jgi:hypothetical protein
VGEVEFLDVVAVGGDVVVAEEGEALIAFGEFGAEAGTGVSAGSFGDVGADGVDALIDLAADVDDAGDFGTAGEVVFVLDGFGLESGGEVIGEIVGAAGHPTGGFDGLGHRVMVGILFVVAPGIPADDGVGLHETDEEDETAD